jgi:hypothetical protein
MKRFVDENTRGDAETVEGHPHQLGQRRVGLSSTGTLKGSRVLYAAK